MRTYSRYLALGATAGVLALCGASLLAAQQPTRDTLQTGAVAPADPSAQPGMRTDTGMTGMRTDTGMAGMRTDTGYTGARTDSSQLKTDTALKAKPGLQTGRALKDSANPVPTDTTTPPTGRVNKKGAGGYQYHGAPTDTALHAKPGTQTGKAATDTGTTTHKKSRRHHKAATSDTSHMRSDTTRSKSDTTKY